MRRRARRRSAGTTAAALSREAEPLEHADRPLVLRSHDRLEPKDAVRVDMIGERADRARGDATTAAAGQQPVADLDAAPLVVVVVQGDPTDDRAASFHDDERAEVPGRLHGRQIALHEGAQLELRQRRQPCLAADIGIGERGRDHGDVLEDGRPDQELVDPKAATRERQAHRASTSARSLSPRPERQTAISSASVSSARARACDDSSAGTMPSVRQRRWKAASASSSVQVT